MRRRSWTLLVIALLLGLGAVGAAGPTLVKKARLRPFVTRLESADEGARWSARLEVLERGVEPLLPSVIAGAVRDVARASPSTSVVVLRPARLDDAALAPLPASAAWRFAEPLAGPLPADRGFLLLYGIGLPLNEPGTPRLRVLFELQSRADRQRPAVAVLVLDPEVHGPELVAPLDGEGETLRLVREALRD